MASASQATLALVLATMLACVLGAAIPTPDASFVSCMSDSGAAVKYWIGLKKFEGFNYLYADSIDANFTVSRYDMQEDKTLGKFRDSWFGW
jgi:hypothetical protein